MREYTVKGAKCSLVFNYVFPYFYKIKNKKIQDGMNMFYVITGGSSSGKSEYAERLATASGLKERIYVATMEVWGEEGQRKVERHRRLRAGKGFTTIECPRDLEKVSLETNLSRAVLVECISNLAANELFRHNEIPGKKNQEGEALDYSGALERLKRGILRLKECCELLVVVTNEVFSDGMDYTPETEGYIRLLGEMNRWMAEESDRVIEVVYGIGVERK